MQTVATAVPDELIIFKEEVEAGLSALPKTLPCRFFYDQLGSDLFRRITRLPEYYLTACELEILSRLGSGIISLVKATKFNLVELGSGDGSKAIQLIEAAMADNREFTYNPIDLSGSAMETLTALVSRHHPELPIRGIVAEYSAGLESLKNSKGPKLVLFLGSNLGNFDRPGARSFLRRIRLSLAPGDLLVLGLDLRKDVETMTRAYNDAQGVTAEFNLNLLRRINRELGGNFDLRRFRYQSTFDPGTGGMDSSLISLSRQQVLIRNLCRTFDFARGEPIHTEHSHKYTEAEISRLAHQAGFAIEANFHDSRKYFVDSVWRVPS